MKYEVEFFDDRQRFRTIIVNVPNPERIPLAIKAEHIHIRKINKYRRTDSKTWILWQEKINATEQLQFI